MEIFNILCKCKNTRAKLRVINKMMIEKNIVLSNTLYRAIFLIITADEVICYSIMSLINASV